MPPPRGLRPTERLTLGQRKQEGRNGRRKEATSGKKETAMH